MSIHSPSPFLIVLFFILMRLRKTSIKSGLKSSQKEITKAQKDLKHAVGLGHKPNQVPEGIAPEINGSERDIELGWHPVGGATGKWFAEKTMIGQAITHKIGKYPDPTQHWAVIVGNFVHQLWMVGIPMLLSGGCAGRWTLMGAFRC